MILQLIQEIEYRDLSQLMDRMTKLELTERTRKDFSKMLADKIGPALSLFDEHRNGRLRYESNVMVLSISTWNDIEERLMSIVRHSSNPVTRQSLLDAISAIRHEF